MRQAGPGWGGGWGCTLLLSTIWGPYLNTLAWAPGRGSWGNEKALPQIGRSEGWAAGKSGSEADDFLSGMLSCSAWKGRKGGGPFLRLCEFDQKRSPTFNSYSAVPLSHIFPPNYFFKKILTKVPIYYPIMYTPNYARYLTYLTTNWPNSTEVEMLVFSFFG